MKFLPLKWAHLPLFVLFGSLAYTPTSRGLSCDFYCTNVSATLLEEKTSLSEAQFNALLHYGMPADGIMLAQFRAEQINLDDMFPEGQAANSLTPFQANWPNSQTARESLIVHADGFQLYELSFLTAPRRAEYIMPHPKRLILVGFDFAFSRQSGSASPHARNAAIRLANEYFGSKTGLISGVEEVWFVNCLFSEALQLPAQARRCHFFQCCFIVDSRLFGSELVSRNDIAAQANLLRRKYACNNQGIIAAMRFTGCLFAKKTSVAGTALLEAAIGALKIRRIRDPQDRVVPDEFEELFEDEEAPAKEHEGLALHAEPLVNDFLRVFCAQEKSRSDFEPADGVKKMTAEDFLRSHTIRLMIPQSLPEHLRNTVILRKPVPAR